MDKTFVWCTLEVEGLHHWPDANVENYLQNPHRHLFKIKVMIEVKHDDRDIEFISLKRWILKQIEKQYGTEIKDFRDMSCEDIAKWILYLVKSYFEAHRNYIVEVSEDGENGAEVMYIPEHKHE